MPETPEELHARAARRAADAAGREWESFPFDGEMRPRRSRRRRRREAAPRRGRPDCWACAGADEDYIWTTSAGGCIRSTPERAAGRPAPRAARAPRRPDACRTSWLPSWASLIARIERAVRAVDGIGRVHVGRWGEGSSTCTGGSWPARAACPAREQLRRDLGRRPPAGPEAQWRADLEAVAAALGE